MAKYIPKEPLMAEIERRRDLHYKYYMKHGAGSIAECKYEEDRDILDFLNSLEVKEVDLEKELVDYHNDNFSQCNDGTLLSSETGSELTWYDYERIAKHFFELGMAASNKAQKGE